MSRYEEDSSAADEFHNLAQSSKHHHDDHHDNNDKSHHHHDDDDDKELTEEEKDLIAVRCLRLFNILLMLIGGGLCGASLWASTTTVAGIGNTLMYAVAGVGGGVFVVTLIGLIGALARVQQILLVYHTCLIFASFAMLVLGGFCFILYQSAVVWVKDNWAYLLQSLPPDRRAEMSLDKYSGFLTYAMFGIGATAIFLLVLLLCAMSNVIRLVTPLKAYTLILQATNTTLLPVGIALIGIAVWVADTAVGQEAIFSAFAIFVMGMFVIILVMVGCTSISLRSRGLIRLFFFITLFLTALFLAFGITSLVAADKVNTVIVGQWQLLRRLLPSSFAGKYDIEQFQAFMNANLRALGFFSLCTGLLMATQTYGAIRLRFELKAANELEEQTIEAANSGLISKEDMDVLLSMRNPGQLEKLWKRTWTKGSKVSRTAVVFTLLFTCFIFLVIMGIAVSALFYSTSCQAVSSYIEGFDYGGQDIGQLVQITNNYTRGRIVIDVKSDLTGTPVTTFNFRKSAYAERMAAPGYPSIETKSGSWGVDIYGGGVDADVTYKAIQAIPATPTKYLNVDVSCQDAELTVTLPPASVLGDNSYETSIAIPYGLRLITGGDQTSMLLDWTDILPGLRPRLARLDMASDAGLMDIFYPVIGPRGMKVTSESGEITIKNIVARCDASDLGGDIGGIRLSTAKGGVTINGGKIQDCDVYVKGSAARCEITDTMIENTLGGSKLAMEGAAGVLHVSNSKVDLLSMNGEAGTVRCINVTIGTSLKVSTSDGKVELNSMKLSLRAGIQVDTDIGNIEIWTNQFAGIVSVVTGGTITCTGTGFDGTAAPCSSQTTDVGADGTSLSVLEQVNVNCQAKGDCPYLGGITITSARGNVILRMDKWVR